MQTDLSLSPAHHMSPNATLCRTPTLQYSITPLVRFEDDDEYENE
jgi:hypothetical protein